MKTFFYIVLSLFILTGCEKDRLYHKIVGKWGLRQAYSAGSPANAGDIVPQTLEFSLTNYRHDTSGNLCNQGKYSVMRGISIVSHKEVDKLVHDDPCVLFSNAVITFQNGQLLLTVEGRESWFFWFSKVD